MSRRGSVKDSEMNGTGKKEGTASAEATSPSARPDVQSPPVIATPSDPTVIKPEEKVKPEEQPPQDAPLAGGASPESKSTGSVSLPPIGSSSLHPAESGSLPRSPPDSKPAKTESSHTQDSSIGRFRDITAQQSPGKKLEEHSRPRTPPSEGAKSVPRRLSQPMSPKTPTSPPHALAPQDSPSRMPGSPGAAWSSWSRVAEELTQSEGEAKRAPAPPSQENRSSEGRPTPALSPTKRARSLTNQRGAQQDLSVDYYTLSPRQLVSKSDTPRPIRKVSSTASPQAVASPSSPDARGRAVRGVAGTGTQSPNLGTVEESRGAGFALRFPLATFLVIWIQLRAHWNYSHEHYPQRCASAYAILREGHWEQLVYAAFHHYDVWHLLTHLYCFFLRGLVLESALGKPGFVEVIALVVVLVGLFNTGIAQLAYALTKSPTLNKLCVYSSSGVIVALDVVNRWHFGHTIVPFRNHLGGQWPLIYGVLEPLVLLAYSKNAPFSVLSGLVVGGLLVWIPVKRMMIRVVHPKLHLHVAAFHWGPTTSFFAAAIVASHVFGPYPEGSAATKPLLTFKHPVRPPWILPALYVDTVYQLAYVILTLLTVGSELELDRGWRWFAQTVLGLLVSVNVVQDILCWIVWSHARAFQNGLPAPFLHSSTCSCGLFGTLLALKIVHNRLHPESVFTMASFCIPMPFWSGLLLEVLTLNLVTSSGSSLGHVIGVLVGILAANVTWSCLVSCARGIWS